VRTSDVGAHGARARDVMAVATRTHPQIRGEHERPAAAARPQVVLRVGLGEVGGGVPVLKLALGVGRIVDASWYRAREQLVIAYGARRTPRGCGSSLQGDLAPSSLAVVVVAHPNVQDTVGGSLRDASAGLAGKPVMLHRCG